MNKNIYEKITKHKKIENIFHQTMQLHLLTFLSFNRYSKYSHHVHSHALMP